MIPTFLITYDLATDEKVAERIAICTPCEEYTSKGICNQCHCLMEAKVKFDEAKCPLGKWT